MDIVEKTIYVCQTNKCKPCKTYSSLVWEYYNEKGREHPDREDYECKKSEEKEVMLNGKQIKVFHVGNLVFYNFRSAKMYKNRLTKFEKPINDKNNKNNPDYAPVTMAKFFEEQVGLRFV